MKKSTILVALVAALPLWAGANDDHHTQAQGVGDDVIAQQNANLAKNTEGKGFGPQSPRDLGSAKGENRVIFGAAPAYASMNLCNIHIHKYAEHKGGQYTLYAGNGDGKGYGTGYKYNGKLTEAELAPLPEDVCKGEHGSLNSGDTIEIHYVHSSAQIVPGPTLGACLSESIKNPQLRVEGRVFVLVNDKNAADFVKLTQLGEANGYHQAVNLPTKKTGKPVQYAGSTTGPSYNEQGSPFQVSWSMGPKVLKVNAESVGQWCKDNVFKEDHAHGVRNLVIDPALLSRMKK